MDSTVIITLVIGGAVLLVLSIFFWSIPFIWYAAGVVCLYMDLTGPGIACLVIGVLIHVFRYRRKPFRN